MIDEHFFLLIKEVMSKLLSGNTPVLNILREQFQKCRITESEMTGAGFFVYFEVASDVRRLTGVKKSFSFGDVKADIDGLEHGAGFLLYVDDGVINCLEGYSYEEPWPENIREFYADYMNKIRSFTGQYDSAEI